MMKVLLITGGRARRVIVLAQQIERHVPGAKICGIVYKVPASSEVALASRFYSVARSVGAWAARLLLAAIHGGRPYRPETTGSDRNALARKCQQAGWDLCVTENIESPEVPKFIREKQANLAAAAGLGSVPRALAGLTLRGIIQGQIFSLDKQGVEAPAGPKATTAVDACRLKVTQLGPQGETLLARFDLSPEPLDTQASLELKGNLILRDLLVQSIAAIAEQPETVTDRMERWIRNMIPSYLSQAGALQEDSIDQAPPLRIRANWKLCIHSLFLFSPSVIVRNWLRHWRKQHPVVFLNSHLISDRHHRMTLPTEAFFRVVKYLQRHYRIVGLSEASRLLKSGSVSEPTVVLTFDDGYEENFLNLRAVAEETGVPVVLFVSTQIVTEHRGFTHDLERGLTGFRALTWDQIRYWSNAGAEFGSHTCSHYDCGSIDQAALENEIVESKHELETQLKKPIAAFAFPFGKPENMSERAIAIAGKTYEHFLSSFGGENLPSTSENHTHLLRKHLQGNAWEAELELQGVLKRFLRLGPPKRKLEIATTGHSLDVL